MILILLASLNAWATWSIVAAEPETGTLGGAGTSCVGNLDVAVIYGSVPGRAAVHAQAALDLQTRDQAVALLAEGQAPQQVLDTITALSNDRGAARRQYGIVDVVGQSAAFTGSDTGSWAGDRQGQADGFIYSAQGNILTGEAVVQRTAQAFERSDACDLPERLLVALTAGRAAGEGDSRCTERGVPADSAFVRVESADGERIIDLSVSGTGTSDPLDVLAAELAAWRETNPCPSPPEPDPGNDTDTSEARPTCGCTGSPGGLSLLLGLAAAVSTRRRRRGPRGAPACDGRDEPSTTTRGRNRRARDS